MQTILVVDDEKPFRDILSETLVKQGFDVKTASNGQEAIDLIKKTTIDLIILDIKMPEMNGNQFVLTLRNELNLRIPYIVLTNVENDLIVESPDVPYFMKSEVTLPEIVVKVKDMLA